MQQTLEQLPAPPSLSCQGQVHWPQLKCCEEQLNSWRPQLGLEHCSDLGTLPGQRGALQEFGGICHNLAVEGAWLRIAGAAVSDPAHSLGVSFPVGILSFLRLQMELC